MVKMLFDGIWKKRVRLKDSFFRYKSNNDDENIPHRSCSRCYGEGEDFDTGLPCEKCGGTGIIFEEEG